MIETIPANDLARAEIARCAVPMRAAEGVSMKPYYEECHRERDRIKARARRARARAAA